MWCKSKVELKCMNHECFLTQYSEAGTNRGNTVSWVLAQCIEHFIWGLLSCIGYGKTSATLETDKAWNTLWQRRRKHTVWKKNDKTAHFTSFRLEPFSRRTPMCRLPCFHNMGGEAGRSQRAETHDRHVSAARRGAVLNIRNISTWFLIKQQPESSVDNVLLLLGKFHINKAKFSSC